MKRRVAPALVALASVAALSFAPAAHADENLYLQQMREPGKLFVGVTNNQLLRLGYVACDVMRSTTASGLPISAGRSASDKAVASMMNSMGLAVDRASFMNITQDAEDYLC